jgi:hypothetical protein
MEGRKMACKFKMDYQLAHACGMDAANRNMRKNGRKAWNEEDYELCWKTFEELWPINEELKEYSRL